MNTLAQHSHRQWQKLCAAVRCHNIKILSSLNIPLDDHWVNTSIDFKTLFCTETAFNPFEK